MSFDVFCTVMIDRSEMYNIFYNSKITFYACFLFVVTDNFFGCERLFTAGKYPYAIQYVFFVDDILFFTEVVFCIKKFCDMALLKFSDNPIMDCFFCLLSFWLHFFCLLC